MSVTRAIKIGIFPTELFKNINFMILRAAFKKYQKIKILYAIISTIT